MRIKKSQRGLTFSFAENDKFRAGTKYRYIVDMAKSEVILIADDAGKYKMSRKGANHKPLVDLRNDEIRKAMEGSKYLEVEIMDDRIIVHIIKLEANLEGLSDTEVSQMIDRSEEVSFAIDKQSLIEHDSALIDMLTASGFFSNKTRTDLSYVYDVVSLFSGAGLLDYPFKKDESFDIKFAVDYDKSACETYRQNIGNHILCMDMRDLNMSDVPDHEVCIGGVPCVGYSNANRAGNEVLNISNRLLIDDYIRVVVAKKPLIFAIENVPEFLTKEQKKYVNKVFEALSDDYNITYSVVNDLDVGGYTKRKRMILIGSIKGMSKIIIPDVELFSHKTSGDALKKVTSEWFNYDDITKASASTQAKMAQVPPGGNYRQIKEMEHLNRHSNVYRRLDENEPAVTIVNWRKVNLMPPRGNRILSVAEACALMGLDKNFKVYGSLNDRQTQIGNGVCQALASFVKCIIKNALYKYSNECLGMNLQVA